MEPLNVFLILICNHCIQFAENAWIFSVKFSLNDASEILNTNHMSMKVQLFISCINSSLPNLRNILSRHLLALRYLTSTS